MGDATLSNESASALTASLDLIDVDDYLQNGPNSAVCERLASCLKHYGAVLIHDSRIQPSDGDRFRALMERYFAQPLQAKMADVHPELHYQVGSTPNDVERPRENIEFYNSLAPAHRPVSAADVAARNKDPKWRFFWRIGKRPPPEMTKFPQLNAPQVVPVAFKDEWSNVMDAFGGKLQTAVESVSEMLALGLRLPVDTFSEKLRHGPHLLAPTGTDLSLPELGARVGATMAGYHYDLNFCE
jgi:isopenicillin N synthase-like dioxygenase